MPRLSDIVVPVSEGGPAQAPTGITYPSTTTFTEVDNDVLGKSHPGAAVVNFALTAPTPKAQPTYPKTTF